MKVLASDFDGTLTHSGHTIMDKDIEVIKQWQAEGNLFGVATGRDLRGVEVGLQGTGLVPDFTICLNGAIIMIGDQEVQHLGIDDEKAEEIEALILKYEDHIPYATKNNGRQSKKIVCDEKHWVSLHFAERSSYADDVTDVTNFIVSTHDDMSAVAIEQEVIDKFSDFAAPHRSAGNFIDIVAPNIHKADALDIVVSQLGIHQDDVIVVGDSFNDLEMIKKYQGYAMHNAEKEIQNQAYGVVSDFSDLLKQALKK